MSAQTLRDAAEPIRVDHPPCTCGDMDCPTIFYEAVAMLLDNEANAQDAAPAEGPLVYNGSRARLLLDVARAYLSPGG
jgi:hypothetical protein